MKIIKNLKFNFVIHSLGSLSSFVVLYLILHTYGVAMQGLYANLMALLSFASVLGIFGFPQSFIFLINKLNISPQKLSYFTLWFCPIFFVAQLVILQLISYFKLDWVDKELVNSNNYILFAFATVNLIFHGLLRGIYLTINQGVGFAIYSVMPAFSIFVLVVISILFKFTNIPLIVFYSSYIVFFYSIYIFFSIKNDIKTKNSNKIPFRELFSHGMHSFLQALFYSVQPLFVFWLIKHFNGTFKEIGYFNIGLLLLQGFLVPVTMLSPYLFEYLTKNKTERFVKRVTNNKIYFFNVILGFLLYFITGMIGHFVFKDKYLIPTQLSQILLFSLPFNIHFRILLPYIHALGMPEKNTYFGLFRLILFIISSFIFVFFKYPILNGIAISWSISEIFTFIVVTVLIKKNEFNNDIK